jgi:predicted HicB family RNase H-like nuclease
MITGMKPNYTYRAEWDAERLEYQARCLEFPGRFAAAFSAHEAVAAMERIVTEELAAIADAGERAPEPLTDRRLSGKFLIRTSPTLHARLVVEAGEQGVSLNQWVVAKLAERPRAFSLDDLFD